MTVGGGTPGPPPAASGDGRRPPPPPPPPDAPPLLVLRDVEAAYGPYRALFGVSFTVPQGRAVALVGANGAGKSTVARVVSGLVPASAGTVRLGDRDITRWPPWRIARAGVAHAPEGRSVLATLTVEENLLLAVHGDRRHRMEGVDRALAAFPLLAARRRQLAGTLSGGEQRMLSLARVAAVPQRLLLVDELSLGLAPQAVDETFEVLRGIRSAGTALLVVEQHLDRVLTIADRVVVLVRGRVAAEGTVAEVQPAIEHLLPANPAKRPAAQQPGGRPARPDAE